MATSENGYFWRFLGSRFNADDPLGAGPVRNVVINNLLHLHDQSTQFLVNWQAHETGARWEKTPSSSGLYEWTGSTSPFAVQLRSGGAPFKVYLRLGGSVSDAAYTATFKALIRRADGPLAYSGGAASAEFTATSTTDSWRGSSLLTLERPEVEASLARVRVEETNGGPYGEAEWYLMRCDVFSKSTNVLGTPRVSGLTLRHYIGT